MEWIEPRPVEVPLELADAVGGHPLVSRILARRGILSHTDAAAFLNPDCYLVSPPTDLPNLAAAADRLELAINKGEKIGVWGDFDVDGQTSTTLLVSGLRSLNADVVYHIPVRGPESHGIGVKFLESFLQSGVRLLLTCDTGIAAHEAVEYAARHHVDVIITDHHILPPELPSSALVIVNPQLLPTGHPLSYLCGVGTAYKLLEELLRRAGREKESKNYIDLVALGTVADVAVLRRDNRYLVQRGLGMLRTNLRPALKAILQQADVGDSFLTEEHIGFVLAPRMNALGRLGDSNPIVDFLTAPSLEEARLFAVALEKINGERKQRCEDVSKTVKNLLSASPDLTRDPVLVFSDSKWPAGVIGIVASRLVEQYHKPALLIATPPGKPAHGSARSVEGIDITAAIAANQQYLLGFGGHTMAAGFSILPENIEPFRRAMIRTIDEIYSQSPITSKISIEEYIPLEEVTPELVEEMDRLAPFGPGNPSIVLACRGVWIKSQHPIGKEKEHRQLVVQTASGTSHKVLWWNSVDLPLPQGLFDLAYSVRSSNYQGQHQVQIEWVDAHEIGEAAVELEPASTRWKIVDLRLTPDPAKALEELQSQEEGLQIWHEGASSKSGPGVGRDKLSPAPALAVWTVPPSRIVLDQVLKTVQPQSVYFFGNNPDFDDPIQFMKTLGGLVNYALTHLEGKTSLPSLAVRCATTLPAVYCGLDYLEASGQIIVEYLPGEEILIKKGGAVNSASIAEIQSRLKIILSEISAYRKYYLNSSSAALL